MTFKYITQLMIHISKCLLLRLYCLLYPLQLSYEKEDKFRKMAKTGWRDIHPIFQVDDNEILHVEEIAKLTKMHTESVRRWCRSGKLPSYQFGGKFIVTGNDFKDFMSRSRVKPRWLQQIEEASLDE